MYINLYKRYGLLILGALTIISCASVQKAELSSQNPREAIIEVEQLRVSGLSDQNDLLANESFSKADRLLNSAKSGLKSGDDKSDILEDLAEAKAYFIEAKSLAIGKASDVERILSARKATLKNGVRESPKLIQDLGAIDELLRDDTDEFTQRLSVEDFSKFEKDYLELEIKSVQNSNLLVFRDILKSAENNDATGLAPKTYNIAKADLRAAENMIQQNPRSPKNYENSVVIADKSAKLLSDVMGKLTGVASGASEEAALKMVYQERKLGMLSERASSLEGSLEKSQGDLTQLSDDLQDKTYEALALAKKVNIQKAMEDVRSHFTNDEADVYQQGNDVIIRLKKVDFKSGSAMVPSKSMNLLSTVNAIVEKLNPEEVVVQGHTDSVGKVGRNQTLSMKRSEAVALYLKSLDANYPISSKGFGESMPIANNETKAGRTMNRRVDIVVTTGKAI